MSWSKWERMKKGPSLIYWKKTNSQSIERQEKQTGKWTKTRQQKENEGIIYRILKEYSINTKHCEL